MAEVEFKAVRYEHEGGTKDYHLLLVRDNRSGHSSFVLRRWGKIGAKGQFKVDEFDSAVTSAQEAEAAYFEEMRTRIRRGYFGAKNQQCEDIASLSSDIRGAFDKDITIRNILRSYEIKFEVEREPEPEPQPELELERGELWGSW